MKSNNYKLNTICTHVGQLEDKEYKGAGSPLYLSTSYAFDGVDKNRYPRLFNTPNQEALAIKMAALEKTESALIFSSGMAAISTALLAFLKTGDHAVLQRTLYGGTTNFIVEEFERFGIEYSFVDGVSKESYESQIKENTRVIYIETPSNPLLGIINLSMIGELGSDYGVVSVIDNTFASPVNQNPSEFGIDVIVHSATKYLGGHSDILAGVVCASSSHISTIASLGKNLGGNLSDFTVWMLERSIKTLGLRVKAQNRNAKRMAKFLEKNEDVARVFYPGLKSHPDYKLAKSQMRGFGGMLSFELKPHINPEQFLKELKLIKPVMSLAGVESTITSPKLTSHALISEEERAYQGIADGLLRFSVGIEDKKDLTGDFLQALEACKVTAGC